MFVKACHSCLGLGHSSFHSGRRRGYFGWQKEGAMTRVQDGFENHLGKTRCGKRVAGLLLLLLCNIPTAASADPPQANADALLKSAYDNWRASSSNTEVRMTVHRPSWERELVLKSWTQGDDHALVRFTFPARDANNATLKIGDDTWVFNPKLNQVIKLPTSMLAQSWMGSDFSYDDLAKSDDILVRYTHKISAVTHKDGHAIYQIEATPKAHAPVVWGKRIVEVRDDGVMMGESFFDQDMKLVRSMKTEQIATIGGRPYPQTMTMRPAGKADSWTQTETISGKFNEELPDYLFTISNLQNRRD